MTPAEMVALLQLAARATQLVARATAIVAEERDPTTAELAEMEAEKSDLIGAWNSLAPAD